MSRKKKIITIAVIIAICGCLIGLAVLTTEQRDNLSFGEKALRRIASPFQHAISNVAGGIDGFFGAFTRYDELEKENENLKLQIQQLSVENSNMLDNEMARIFIGQ